MPTRWTFVVAVSCGWFLACGSGHHAEPLELPGVAGVQFSEHGVRLDPHLRLRFSAWGREGAERAVAPSTPQRRGDRIEYARGNGLVEWWVSVGASLEQGWTLAARPSGAGPIAFVTAIEGAPPAVGKVAAWDARGVELPTTARNERGALRIVVDDAGAHYPITVDPFYGLEVGGPQVLGTIGDFNGDGAQDMISYDLEHGYYCAYYGRPVTGPHWWECQILNVYGVRSIGDVNGDGFDDTLLKGPNRWVLHPGSAGGIDIDGGVPYDDFVSPWGGSDINGDGLADIVDEYYLPPPLGAYAPVEMDVYLSHAGTFSSPPTQTLMLDSPDVLIEGQSKGFAFAGDVNGDGYDDMLAVDSWGEVDGVRRGWVRLHLGGPTGLSTTPTVQLAAPALTDGSPFSYGDRLARLGDVNGDGYDDIATEYVISYRDRSSTGMVEVYYGGPAGLPPTPSLEIPTDYSLPSLMHLGDIDGDGYDELAIGDPYAATDVGKVDVYPGSPDGPLLAYPTSVWGNGQFGRSLVGGDIDGDGLADLMVGTRFYDAYRGQTLGYASTIFFGCPDANGDHVCDDYDRDGILNQADNCSGTPNPDQADTDGDHLGDACDACPHELGGGEYDYDHDLVVCHDNCPHDFNPRQEDADHDGVGDRCDRCPRDAQNDVDGDGVCGDVDTCPLVAGSQADADGDGAGDLCDVCPLDAANDADADGICGEVDNCPLDANADQIDTDGDGSGDRCDGDDDGDGVFDLFDVCPLTPDPEQADWDRDGAGDACDADVDGDGVVDAEDACLLTAAGAPVEDGCSIEQLCPCNPGEGSAPWRNHGAYFTCVRRAAERFEAAGTIDRATSDAIIGAAGQSACGRRP